MSAARFAESVRVKRAVEHLEASSPTPLAPDSVHLNSCRLRIPSLPPEAAASVVVVEEEPFRPVERTVAHIEAAITKAIVVDTNCAADQMTIAKPVLTVPAEHTSASLPDVMKPAQCPPDVEDKAESSLKDPIFPSHSANAPVLETRCVESFSQSSCLSNAKLPNESNSSLPCSNDQRRSIGSESPEAHLDTISYSACQSDLHRFANSPLIDTTSRTSASHLATAMSENMPCTVLGHDRVVPDTSTSRTDAKSPERGAYDMLLGTPKCVSHDLACSPVTPALAQQPSMEDSLSATASTPAQRSSEHANCPFPSLDASPERLTRGRPSSRSSSDLSVNASNSANSAGLQCFLSSPPGSTALEQGGKLLRSVDETHETSPCAEPMVERSLTAELSSTTSHHNVSSTRLVTTSKARAPGKTPTHAGSDPNTFFRKTRKLKPLHDNLLSRAQQAQQPTSHQGQSFDLRVIHDGDRDDRSVRGRGSLFPSMFHEPVPRYARVDSAFPEPRRTLSSLGLSAYSTRDVSSSFATSPDDFGENVRSPSTTDDIPTSQSSPNVIGPRSFGLSLSSLRGRAHASNVTTPRPFQLPGDKFYERARANIESKRREAEIMDMTPRLYKARAMPDFSRDPRKVRQR